MKQFYEISWKLSKLIQLSQLIENTNSVLALTYTYSYNKRSFFLLFRDSWRYSKSPERQISSHTVFWIKGYPLKDKNFNYKTSADLVSKLQFFCSKSRLPKNCCRTSRDKNILEQIPRPRFFRVLKFPAIFSICLARRKEREISKPGKNRGLKSCSNIFFPLILFLEWARVS